MAADGSDEDEPSARDRGAFCTPPIPPSTQLLVSSSCLYSVLSACASLSFLAGMDAAPFLFWPPLLTAKVEEIMVVLRREAEELSNTDWLYESNDPDVTSRIKL